MHGPIVAGTDGSDTAAEALRRAATLAETYGVPLHVVTAYDAKTGEDAAQAVLERTAAGIDGAEVVTHARQGDPADAIIDVAEEIDAGTIVVGNRGMTGASRFLLGSVPDKISHHAPCNVLIVRTT